MNNAESCDFWVPCVFFDHNIHGVAPASENCPVRDYQVHEFRETGKKGLVLKQCFIMTEVSSRGRGRGLFFPLGETVVDILGGDGGIYGL